MSPGDRIAQYRQNPRKNTPHEEQSLRTLMAEETPRIEEQEFLSRWIGLFWEREKYPEVPAAWVDRVATSPRFPVEIVSNGEVVAIVPAMIGPSVTEFVSEHKSTLGALSASAIATSNNFPQLGETYLTSALLQNHENISARPEVVQIREEYRDGWVKLFTKYGLIQSVSEEEQVTAGPNNELNEDEFGDIDDDF